MFPVSGLQPNKRKMALPANSKKQGQKVDEAQSKNIMGELFNELDQNDADDLAEPANNFAAHEQVVNDQGLVAFSKHEEMQFKADNAQNNNASASASKSAISTGKLVPSANPFSKKRRHDEITKETGSKPTNGNASAPPNEIPEDTSMHEEHKSVSVQNADNTMENVSAVKDVNKSANASLPNSTSNIEEDWRRLKQ